MINKIAREGKSFVELVPGTKKTVQKWKTKPDTLLTMDDVRYSDNPIGVILKPDIVRIDIDDGKRYRDYIKALSYKTLTVKTKRGYHIYFKDPNNLSKKWKKGEYVFYNHVMAEFFPAGHTSVAATWINEPDKRVIRKCEDLMELPLEFTPMKRAKKDDNGKFVHVLPIAEGDRDNTIFRIACILKDKFSEDKALNILQKINTHCNISRPLPEKDVEAKIKAVTTNYETNYVDAYSLGLIEEDRVIHPRVVNYLLEDDIVYVIKEGEERIPVIWHKNQFMMYSEDYIRMRIQRIIPDKYVTDALLSSIVRLILRTVTVQTSWDRFNKYDYKIYFENCVYNIKTKKVEEHNPNNMNTYHLPHHYDESMDCDIEDTYLWSHLFQKYQFDDDDLQMLFEYMSYNMLTFSNHKCFMILEGPSNTGKSLLLNIVSKILGEHNTSNVEIHELNTRFRSSELFNVMMNSDGDGKSKALTNIANLKKMTGGDKILNENKGRKVWTFRPYAKHWFAFNQLPPQLEEKSDAFYNRLRILAFHDPLKLNDKQVQKMYAHVAEFIPALIPIITECYHTGISNSERSKNMISNLQLDSDPVARFVSLTLITTDDEKDFVPKSELFDRYLEYCVFWNIDHIMRKNFYKRIEAILPDFNRKVHRGQRVVGISGYKLKEIDE